MREIGKRLLDQLPDMKLPSITLPTLTKEVPVAVYLIHNSRDPEDYFFLFDFEEFVGKSNAGHFVRPVLQVYAGRDDFSRMQFARQFREVFAAEFQQMRNEMAERRRKGAGWISFGLESGTRFFRSFDGIVPYLILGSALTVSGGLGLLFGKSRGPRKKVRTEVELEDEIEKTKNQVEDALTRIDVTVHPELHAFAWRDGPRGPIGDMDRNAWPLPDYVRANLTEGKSSSWW